MTPRHPVSPLVRLLGAPGDPPQCKILAPDLAMHWFRVRAKPGDPCYCGKTSKREDDE